MVVLSGYENPIYDEVLPDWIKKEKKSFADGAKERTEILWINPRCNSGSENDLFPHFALRETKERLTKLESNMKNLKIKGFQLALIEGTVFELKSRGWFIYHAEVVKVPNNAISMPRETLNLLLKQKIFGQYILGIESFAKVSVTVGDIIGIALSERVTKL